MEKKSMGELISSLRKEKGMTQKDLATKMNVTDKAVSKWERNISCPDINTLPLLANVLDISVDELLNTSPKEKESENETEKIIRIALNAIPLAMGIAVLVTSILGELTTESGFSMLAIGLICIAISAFRSSKDKEK